MVPSGSADRRPSSVTADRRETVLSAPPFATGGRLTMVTVVVSGADLLSVLRYGSAEWLVVDDDAIAEIIGVWLGFLERSSWLRFACLLALRALKDGFDCTGGVLRRSIQTHGI